MQQPSTRRRFLASTALTGVVAAAGCLSAGETPTGDGNATTETDELTPPGSLENWLADANGYDGERRSYGRGARPTIDLGRAEDDSLGFTPAVIEVRPFTDVTWNWTDHGGQHNVVALDGTFDSGRTNGQLGTSYHYFFEETGEYPFVCEPHRDDGAKGAVIVREIPSTGYDTVDEWLAETGNFEGTIADRTDSDTATVTVGAEGNGGAFAFDPPAVKVRAGSTVRWEWTGDGGGHNVVFEDEDIGTEDIRSESTATFEHTFEEAGQYRYSCLPHKGLGMRGAVVVD